MSSSAPRCSKGRRYHSRDSAAESSSSHPYQRRGAGHGNPWHCSDCGGWHRGSARNGQANAQQQRTLDGRPPGISAGFHALYRKDDDDKPKL